MSVTLHLKPELEAGLAAEAHKAGLSLDEFLSQRLEMLAKAARPQAHLSCASDEWEKQLDEWLGSFPQIPVLPDEALNRETWYPDRW